MTIEKALRPRPTVAILGGGLCGAAVAYHLARALPEGAAEIVVVEPRAGLGQGLAYGTDEPAHRINVPAAKMSLHADDLGHFTGWLTREAVPLSPGTRTPEGALFPERRIFGAYVGAALAPLLAEGAVIHRRAAVGWVSYAEGRYEVALTDGTTFAADLVVLAMTHPAPALPRALAPLAGSPRLIADPYDTARIAAIGAGDRVLVVGTGLTSADVIAALDRHGHEGPITAVSRNGLRSRGHGMVAAESAEDFAAGRDRTALGLLGRIRAAVARDKARGRSWHAVLDRVRVQGDAIWAGLGPAERARLVRHLRRFWDVHRFRIAPQVEAVLERRIAEGTLDYRAARLTAAREAADGLHIRFRPRRGGAETEARFDAVVVTTGPDHGAATRANPALRALAAEGLITADPLGLGLRVAGRCRAVGGDGVPSPSLFVVGPLARGDVGELMGVPEVTRHAEEVAAVLAARIASEPEAVWRAALRAGRG